MFCLRGYVNKILRKIARIVLQIVSLLQNEENEWFADQQEVLIVQVRLRNGVGREAAKEVSRVLLPEGLTMSNLYMNGLLCVHGFTTQGYVRKRGNSR